MRTPPRYIGPAEILKFADLSASARTGATRHVVRGADVTDFAALAIAQYPSDPGFYLFYCDEDWDVVTDTYHESIDAAIEQAAFEFDPIAFVDLESRS